MIQKLPEWLNKSFLEAAFERKEPKLTVEDFSVELAVAAGNNYTSQIFRVQVRFKTEESSKQSTTLIIKDPHARLENITREPLIYGQLLPRIKEKIKQDFSAIAYYSKEPNVLILQDLKEMGYIVFDKFKQLDYAHCKIVFELMAKFHAASVALHNENAEEIEKLGVEVMYKEGSSFVKMTRPMLGTAVGIVTAAFKETKISEQTIQFLINRTNNFFESLRDICKPKQMGLNVMNHGDLWNNNILFKHNDSGEVTDVKFIDYQITRYMSPAIDILYFTWSSANEDVRENRLQRLYNVYLQTLNDSLTQLGCEERYTALELQEDIKSLIDFAIATVLLHLPFMLAEPEDVFDMSEFDFDEFADTDNNGVIDPKMLRIFNGKHFKAKGPQIINEIHRAITG